MLKYKNLNIDAIATYLCDQSIFTFKEFSDFEDISFFQLWILFHCILYHSVIIRFIDFICLVKVVNISSSASVYKFINDRVSVRKL